MLCSTPQDFVEERYEDFSMVFINYHSSHEYDKLIKASKVTNPVPYKSYNPLPPDDESWTAYMIHKSGIIVGYIWGDISPSKEKSKHTHSSYISFVNIHPDWLGKKLCYPLVKFAMCSLIKNKVTLIKLTNVGGIPACRCYIRAGKSLGMTINRGRVENVESCNIDVFRFEIL